jgi:hypothetical protein
MAGVVEDRAATISDKRILSSSGVTSLDEFMSTRAGRLYFNPRTVSTTASAPALRSTAIA